MDKKEYILLGLLLIGIIILATLVGLILKIWLVPLDLIQVITDINATELPGIVIP